MFRHDDIIILANPLHPRPSGHVGAYGSFNVQIIIFLDEYFWFLISDLFV